MMFRPEPSAFLDLHRFMTRSQDSSEGIAMSYDAVIQIFGGVDDIDVVKGLAESMAEEGLVDWEYGIDKYEALSLLVEKAQDGKAVTLMRMDTRNLFGSLTYYCQQHGISYLMQYTNSGNSELRWAQSWKPGMETEFKYVLQGDKGRPMIPTDELIKATASGLGVVEALIEEVMAKSLSTVSKKLKVDDAVLQIMDGNDLWVSSSTPR